LRQTGIAKGQQTGQQGYARDAKGEGISAAVTAKVRLNIRFDSVFTVA